MSHAGGWWSLYKVLLAAKRKLTNSELECNFARAVSQRLPASQVDFNFLCLLGSATQSSLKFAFPISNSPTLDILLVATDAVMCSPCFSHGDEGDTWQSSWVGFNGTGPRAYFVSCHRVSGLACELQVVHASNQYGVWSAEYDRCCLHAV